MGMFDGIENKKASANGGRFIVPGHYLARIDRVKAGTSSSGQGEFVAIEKTILSALPDGDVPFDEDWNRLSTDQWHRPGEQVSHLLMAKHASFQSNFKAFVANVGDLRDEEVTKERCLKVTEGGVFDGLFVEVRASTIKTKSTGRPFTRVGYVREVPPSEIKERIDAETLDRILGPGVIDELISEYE